MLEPAPTTKIDPELARGTLEDVVDATATQPAYVVLSFANTSYRTHLLPAPASALEQLRERVGKRAIGTIRAEAKRVDVVRSGGRYVEPVYGRPRRVQGSVVAVHPETNSITVHAGMPIVCKLTAPGQKAANFEPGQFVSFDVLRGATFTPQAVSAAKDAGHAQQQLSGVSGS